MDQSLLTPVVCLVLLCCQLVPPARCDYVRARESYKCSESLSCSFTASQLSSPCDQDLRQVFRILSVSDSIVTIGSTECIYALDQELGNPRSAAIQLDSAGVTTCEFAIPTDQRDFRCKNYISYGYQTSTAGSSNEFRVCGTFSSSEPKCFTCTDDGSMISCGAGVATVYMPRTPSQNFTVIKAADNGQDYYFIGGLKSHTSPDHIFAKVEVSNAAVTSSDAVETDSNQEQLMYEPQDFVGEPIEHGNFIYFFFRERAKEYDNIGQIIYSRVARVCKNDVGGATNPLSKQFTTYLKTRLTCSVGTDFPFYFNEIQDVKQGISDPNIVYGLFTTPNAGTSSSAICRYDLTELDVLFNTDERRGQPSSTESWKSITNIANDQEAQRTCSQPYDALTNVYEYLEEYPLMNTNAPNCGFTTSPCSSFTRASDDALAVYEGVRGQSLAILEDSASDVKAFIGTNNLAILQTSINATHAEITQKLVVVVDNETVASFTLEQIDDKWPYGVSYLNKHNGAIYGTLDNCAFRFDPNAEPETTSPHIVDRSPSMVYNHSMNIPGAVTSVSKLFEAPQGTQMQATFSGLFEPSSCQQKRFALDSTCREFLHVLCEVSSITSSEIGSITVSSLSRSSFPLVSDIQINLDESDAAKDVSLSDISKYDSEIAEYEYRYRQWLKDDVTCNDAKKTTCPMSSECCGNC